jgi:hypothetical protein
LGIRYSIYDKYLKTPKLLDPMQGVNVEHKKPFGLAFRGKNPLIDLCPQEKGYGRWEIGRIKKATERGCERNL